MGYPPTLKLRWVKENRYKKKDPPSLKLWWMKENKGLRPTFAEAMVDERE